MKMNPQSILRVDLSMFEDGTPALGKPEPKVLEESAITKRVEELVEQFWQSHARLAGIYLPPSK